MRKMELVVEFDNEEELLALIIDLVHIAAKLYADEDTEKAYPVLKALDKLSKAIDIDEILKRKTTP